MDNIQYEELKELSRDEAKTLKCLLARYLRLRCVHCESLQFEDRHIVTCWQCGAEISDIATIVNQNLSVVGWKEEFKSNAMDKETYRQQRKTQFLGFAKALYEELARNVLNTPHKELSQLEAFKQEQYTIIARRAYDLAKEAFYTAKSDCTDCYEGLDLKDVSDLVEFPAEEDIS